MAHQGGSGMTDEMRAGLIRLAQERQEPGSTATIHALGCAGSRGETCDCEPLVFTVGEGKA
jgi:hypothetical protein